MTQEPFDLFFRIFIAAVLGGILGIERDIHGRQAGLRTHLLVAAGSALFFILSTHIATLGVESPDGFAKVTDPGRIAAQVVTGIGFLGAGVILREGFTIVGLTTAACLWISAAIGMTSGAGLYFIAIGTTTLALSSLILLRWFEQYYRKDAYRELELKFSSDTDVLKILDIIKDDYVTITSMDIEKDYENFTTIARLSLRFFYKGEVGILSHKTLNKIEQSKIPIKHIKWIRH